jgi:hypothetical protein
MPGMLEEKRIMSLVTKMPGLGLISLLAVSLVLAVGAGDAHAVTPAPAWSITSNSSPSNFPAGGGIGQDVYALVITNIGGASTDGSPITITDVLPPGLTVNQAPVGAEIALGLSNDAPDDPTPPCDFGPPVTCTQSRVIAPGGRINVNVPVLVGSGALDPVINHVSVSGGGAPTVSATESTPITSAPAAFGFQSMDAAITDAAGDAQTQAGSHPYQFHLGFQLNTYNVQDHSGTFQNGPAGAPKDVKATLPVGMVVDPTATPVRCTEAQLETTIGSGANACPLASAIGTAHVTTSAFFGFATPYDVDAVYNMVPPPGVPASFAFNAAGLGIYAHLLGGTDAAGNYALTANTKDILQNGGISGFSINLWGNPSDPSHDSRRAGCATALSADQQLTCPVPATDTPLLTMPSACASSLSASLSIDSWQNLGSFISRSAQFKDSAGNTTPVTGCERLDFSPSIGLGPTSREAGSPSGLDVDLTLPQWQRISNLSEATLKKAVVTLPVGSALSASAADGLQGCSEGQIGLVSESPIRFNNNDPACPDGSVVGTAVITTPLLPDPIAGKLYVAGPNNNPFHTLLSGYLVAQGQGITIKLAGRFDRDPVTGQITATFDENPQLPFSKLHLELKSGARAPLVNGGSCGTTSAHSALTPWSVDTPVSIDTAITLDQNCDPGPFAPSFSAGTTSPVAGAHTPFTLSVGNGQPVRMPVGRIDTVLPQGLLGQISSVPICPEDKAAAGTCDGGSKIGSTTLKLGAGTLPYGLPGPGKAPTAVYLAGPYKGAPFSLSIMVPAQAGPFDLGTVVVRAGLYVDPITAQVTVKSDPLPTILDGIPTTLAGVNVNIDRPGFTFNPTSCDAKSIDGSITPVNGATGSPAVDANGLGVPTDFGTPVAVSSRFQVGSCSDLALKPSLGLTLSGKGQTTDGKHPAVTANLTQTAGQANLKKVRVALPLSLALDPDNANGLCEFVDGSKAEPTCPKASIVGTATATTPVLDGPVSGPVYFVKNIRKDPKSGREIRTLPKLVIPLTGQNGVKLTLTGTSNVEDDQLVTTFDNIPDAPVSSFKLSIIGGKGGILTVSGTDICKATQVAEQQIDGQNGKQADTNIYIQTPSCALKVLSKKVGKTSVTLKVGGLGAGKVTVTGHGIKKTTKTITKSAVATITAKRTKTRIGKVTVSFDPTGPAKAHKTTK